MHAWTRPRSQANTGSGKVMPPHKVLPLWSYCLCCIKAMVTTHQMTDQAIWTDPWHMGKAHAHRICKWMDEWMNGDYISCDAGTAAVWAEFHVHVHACLKAWQGRPNGKCKFAALRCTAWTMLCMHSMSEALNKPVWRELICGCLLAKNAF